MILTVLSTWWFTQSRASARLGMLLKLATVVVVPIAVAGCAADAGTGAEPDPVGHTASTTHFTPATKQQPATQPTTAVGGACPSSVSVDQSMPTVSGPDASWDMVNGVRVPGAASYGPHVKDADGLRRCYARSPIGALFAAYNYIVAMSPADDESGEKTFSVLRRIMSPGQNRDLYFDYLRDADDPTTNDHSELELVGYSYVTASPDRAVIIIAARAGAGYASSWWRLNWQDGDWKVEAPQPGQLAGDPYDGLTDLAGFVPWRAP
ncbi:hypothetical protein AB0F43_31440 [Kribbella sp. NPDC023972]|uniref:hypothetical protein n=1 Tax=Kribbella sp. NPDC023972 TaxID=3154795 RepID=UPI0033CF7804